MVVLGAGVGVGGAEMILLQPTLRVFLGAPGALTGVVTGDGEGVLCTTAAAFFLEMRELFLGRAIFDDGNGR